MSIAAGKYEVGVGILSIPDGVDAQGGIKLSLVITPFPNPQSGPVAKLDAWPREIARLMAKEGLLRVQFYDAYGRAQGQPIQPPLPPSVRLSSAVNHAQTIWSDLFPGDQFDLLHSVLEDNDQDPPKEQRIGIPSVTQYDAAEIAAIIGQLKSETVAVTLRARLIEAEQKSAWSKTAPAKGQDKAAYLNAQSPYRFRFARTMQNALAPAFGERAGQGSRYRAELDKPGGSPEKLQFSGQQASSWRQQMLYEDYRRAIGKPVVGAARAAGQPDAKAFWDGMLQGPRQRAIAIGDFLLDPVKPALGSKRPLRFLAGDGRASGREAIAAQLRGELESCVRQFSGAVAPAESVGKQVAATAEEDPATEAVRYKYSGLLARPTLARLLNLVVDLTIPAAQLATLPQRGFVGAYVAGAPASRVAYCRESAQEFRPLAASEAHTPMAPAPEVAKLSLPLLKGCVAVGNGEFALSSTDIHAAVNSTKVKLQELHSAQIEGADTETLSPRPAEERNRGIQLLHRRPADQVYANEEQPGSSTDIYAEQLVTGYRAFVQRASSPEAEPRPWLSLMARSVKYGPIAAMYPTAPGEPAGAWKPYAEFQQREFGQLRPLPRVEPGSKGLRALATSHVFTWVGESLGLPTADTPEEPPSCEDLLAEWDRTGMRIEYDYAPGKNNRLPALRIGHAYQVGLAPVYLHGGGPTLHEARELFDAHSDLTLGTDPTGEPFFFGRRTDYASPTVLLPHDDRIVTRKPIPRNEHAERIVLRTGGGENTRQVRRFLVPPKTDFTTAEQYGVFDAVTDELQGAFERYKLDKETGDFPKREVKGPNGRSETVQILSADRRDESPKRPYYPDPGARNLGLGFERSGRVPQGFPDRAAAVSFWDTGTKGDPRACLDARPIALRFERWPEARLGGKLRESRATVGNPEQDVPELVVSIAPAEQVNLWVWCWPDLPALMRSMPDYANPFARNFMLSDTKAAREFAKHFPGDGPAPADATEYGMSEQQFGASKLLAQYLHSFGASDAKAGKPLAGIDLAPFEAATEAIAKALFCSIPLNGISGWRKIEVVHAVAKPRMVPSIPNGHFYPVRLLPGVTLQQHCGGCSSDGKLESQPGGTRLHFSGQIRFDPAATRSIRVEAHWPLLAHEQAIRDINADKPGERPHFIDRPPRVDQILFDIQDIPRDPRQGQADLLDLLKDEAGRFRELCARSGNAGEGDTAARIMQLRIVATSRFSEFFAPEPDDRPFGQLGKFEVESRPVFRPDAPPAKWARDYEFTVKATVRPPAPVVTRIDWIAPEERVPSGANGIVLRKHYFPRLYLDKSWRVSGEHELLAVVFQPRGTLVDVEYERGAAARPLMSVPLAPAANVVSSLADEFGRFLAKAENGKWLPAGFCDYADGSTQCKTGVQIDFDHITRWGADPTAAPMGKIEAMISPNRFGGHVAAVSKIIMPLPASPDQGAAVVPPIEVGVLLYKPQLDPNTGSWFVDIGIDPGAAHAPFVRLAVARYQPDALNEGAVDLRMSPPLVMDPIRVPAARTVEIRQPVGKPVEVSIYGVGYLRREPYGVSQAVRHLTDMPVQDISLVRNTGAGPGAFLPVQGPEGQLIRTVAIQPLSSGPVLRWQTRFTLPGAETDVQYGLHIREFDMHIPDHVLAILSTDADFRNPPLARGLQDLEARPAWFSATIDLAPSKGYRSNDWKEQDLEIK